MLYHRRRLETMFQRSLYLRRRGSQLDSIAPAKATRGCNGGDCFGIAIPAMPIMAITGEHNPVATWLPSMPMSATDRTAVHATPSAQHLLPIQRQGCLPASPFTPEPDSHRLWNVGSLNQMDNLSVIVISEEEKARHVFESLRQMTLSQKFR